MERRNFLRWSSLLGLGGLLPARSAMAHSDATEETTKEKDSDRTYWVSLLDKIATPVLSNMAKGELHKNMEMRYSATWDGRDAEVGYLEAFGRLMGGIAPFFNLTDDETHEGKTRARLRQQLLASIANAVDPQSPDYLMWYTRKAAQPLVDAAYVVESFIRAPAALWEPLSDVTKQRYINEFKGFRKQRAFNNNWVLFSTLIESFLLSIGETDIVFEKIDQGLDKVAKWYVGDGWYSDGPSFAFDHYNGYDMHCMVVDALRINVAKGRRSQKELDTAFKRMQRYAHFQERYISPEGYYLIIGRSSTYRTGAFQPLAQLALEDKLPAGVTPAQVRCALTAVKKHVFIPSTFTEKGWLRLGLVGDKQQDLADYYSNTGSMYMTAASFLPLGLPASHPFWSDPFTEWTQLKAWTGKPFPKDYHVDY